MNKAWSDEAWDDYLYWYQQGNKATIKNHSIDERY